MVIISLKVDRISQIKKEATSETNTVLWEIIRFLLTPGIPINISHSTKQTFYGMLNCSSMKILKYPLFVDSTGCLENVCQSERFTTIFLNKEKQRVKMF